MWSDPIDESEDEEEASAAPAVLAAEEPHATMTGPPTQSPILHQLYRAIYQSRGKLCFFLHQPEGQTTETWYFVQVNLDMTDLVSAKEFGQRWEHWVTRRR
jgi:hypothetical protein